MLRVFWWLAPAALAAWLVTVSWMRWMDPVIDFGREVYLPWRVLNGEHLGRDFVHPYGPLSVYLNAALFGVLGISIRTLVIANLAVFAGILVCLFGLARRSFGFFPATIVVMIAVGVFGFGHYWGVNNYTFAAPYSHEATHGMLLLLLLVGRLGRLGTGATRRDGFLAGALVALCCLTKTEYVFVSGLLWILGGWRVGAGSPGGRSWITASVLGFAAVFGVAFAALATVLPASLAAHTVTNAILAPFRYRAYTGSTHVLHFLGADKPWDNLRTILVWSGGTLALGAAVTIAGRVAARGNSRLGRWVFLGVAIGVAAWVAWKVNWVFCGTAFPVLLTLGLVSLVRRARGNVRAHRPHFPTRDWNRLLYLTAGIGLLVRMALDPTISHYGFFQALLAGTWVTGFLLAEWPGAIGANAHLRSAVLVAVLVMLAGATVALVRRSHQFYAIKRAPIGEGADRIYGYNEEIHALPAMWERARSHLAKATKPSDAVLVLPEGVGMNYWIRRQHPVRIMDLLPATLALEKQDLVSVLTAAPPEFVVVVSRNMEEFGFRAYGQDNRSGQTLVEWVSKNYSVTYHQGDNPLSPPAIAVWVLRYNRR